MDTDYKKAIKAIIFFGSISTFSSLLFKQYSSVIFTLLMTISTAGFAILYQNKMQSSKTKIPVYFACVFLMGFPLFHLSQHLVTTDTQVEQQKRQMILSGYQEKTQKMMNTTPEDFVSLLDSEETIFLYLGRESCPYCQQFVTKLQGISLSDIYYIDTEEKSEALYAFAETYQITSIPQLIQFHKGEIQARLDISKHTKTEEIQKFLENNSQIPSSEEKTN